MPLSISCPRERAGCAGAGGDPLCRYLLSCGAGMSLHGSVDPVGRGTVGIRPPLHLSLALAWPAQRRCPLPTAVACPAFGSAATSPRGERTPPAPAAAVPAPPFPGHPSLSFPPHRLCQTFAFASPLHQRLKSLRFQLSPSSAAGFGLSVVSPRLSTTPHDRTCHPVDVCSANAAFTFWSKSCARGRELLRRGEDVAFKIRPVCAFPQTRVICRSAVP